MVQSAYYGTALSARHCKAMLLTVSILFLMCLSIGPSAAETPCTLHEVASLPAVFQNNEVLIDVEINDTKVKFRVGSGSQLSRISSSLAHRLTLPVKPSTIRIVSASGTIRPDNAIVSELRFGSVVSHNSVLIVAEHDGGDGTSDEGAGVLSGDYLGNFDLELDPAENRVNLFSPVQCPDRAAYWANEHFELPVIKVVNTPVVRVTLDGKEFNARISTESEHSSVDVAVARHDLDVPADIKVSKVPFASTGGEEENDPSYTFKELVFGPITIRHPPLKLEGYRTLEGGGDTQIRGTLSAAGPIVIGMDILSKFHSLISYGTGKIYFTLANERNTDSVHSNTP